jgi:hypothetical protein
MIYGETGRFPLDIKLRVQLICFWKKLIQCNVSKLSSTCYFVLLQLFLDGDYESNWLSFVKRTLEESGLSYIWENQHEFINILWLKTTLTNVLQDQYVTNWHSMIDNSPKCILYKNIKQSFSVENYLLICPLPISKLILKIRTSNHSLPIETGRYNNIERAERLCDHCKKLGDEFHYIFECTKPIIVHTRQSCIKRYYYVNPSMFKFIEMCNFMLNRKAECVKLTKLIKCIFKNI